MARKKLKKVKILKLALLVFSVYIVVSFTMIQIDIAKRREGIDEIKDGLKQEQYINQEILNILSSGKNNEYIMRIAREKLGYVFPEEKVFLDSGNSNK